MHKFEATVAFKGSSKSFPRTTEAEDLHAAAIKVVEEFKAENPGKDCKLIHIRMVNPPVVKSEQTDF